MLWEHSYPLATGEAFSVTAYDRLAGHNCNYWGTISRLVLPALSLSLIVLYFYLYWRLNTSTAAPSRLGLTLLPLPCLLWWIHNSNRNSGRSSWAVSFFSGFSSSCSCRVYAEHVLLNEYHSSARTDCRSAMHNLQSAEKSIYWEHWPFHFVLNF